MTALLRLVMLLTTVLALPTAYAVDRAVEDEERAAIEVKQARTQIAAQDYAAAEQLLGGRTRAHP